MKKVIVLILVSMLAGCHVKVESYYIDAALQLCKEHRGIQFIHTGSPISVTCRDGQTYTIGSAYRIN